MNVASSIRDACGRDPAAALPFEDILAPYVERAMDAAGLHLALFGDAARATLARSLLHKLSSVSALPLLDAFDRRRPPGRQLLARLLAGEARAAAPAAESGRDRYDGFVAEMVAGGFERLLGEHRALAGLIAAEAGRFHAASVEMAERLSIDLPAIGRRFGWHGDPGRVAAVRIALSDPHRGGRSVAILEFESGAAIVYKPRDLGADAAFHRFRRLCDPAALAPRFLLRDGYGWMEPVEQAFPTDLPGHRALCAAFGRLMAILYLLGATDCHWENVIVRGTEPVLIDAETALQPPMPAVEADSAGPGDPWRWDHVLRSGMLPGWLFSPDGGGACDASALGRLAQIRGAFPAPRWRDVNTDAMTLGEEPAPMVPLPERATIDVDAIVEGFTTMYRSLESRRDELSASAAFLALRDVRLRLVARPTQAYGQQLMGALDPHRLADGDALRAWLERLPPLTSASEDGPWSALRDAEIEALERRDIPYFTMIASGGPVTACNGDEIDVPRLRPAFDDAVARFARFGELDCQRQARLIRGSFDAVAARLANPVDALAPWPSDAPAAFEPAQAALAIADGLAAQALRDGDGSVAWLGLHLHEKAECFSLQRLDPFLYEGNAGVALFLAAAAARSERSDLRALALAALAPVRQPAAGGRGVEAGLGAGTGLGSRIYALTRCAAWLGEEALIEDALRLAGTLDDAAIAAEPAADALSGLAGAILALLALHESSGNADVLARADGAGRRLLDMATAAPRYTGLAHGSSGIALAFARLAEAGGDIQFRAAAREAIAFERASFDTRAGGWPDFRFTGTEPDGSTPCSTMWCHGAPGIGLARLALLPIADDTAFADEIETAIAATLDFGLRSADHLCCGNFGRIDFLVEAGLRLGRPDLHRRAAAAAAARLAHRAEAGRFGLSSDDAPEALKPSLFRGLAGIGYTLLRLAAPAKLPTVLTWS